MRRLAALCALLPCAALAGPFDGVYKQAANADCANIGAADGAVEIAEGFFYGVQVECAMTRPVDVVDMDATLYTLECTGDDQTWSERVMLMQQADVDGIIMVWNGYAFAYDRCTDPSADDDTPTEVAAD